MKSIVFFSMLLTFSVPAMAKIVSREGKFYVVSNGERNPLFLVNKLVSDKAISKIRLYKKGNINMISFAKKYDRERLYSVDEKGFVYSIDPFASYSVDNVDEQGRIQFKEMPGRKYHISSKGFFLY